LELACTLPGSTMNTPRWVSAITHYTLEAPDDLLANPLNIKIHPLEQMQALEAVLDAVGWVQAVVVNDATGNVIDGHARIMLALQRNVPQIPVAHVTIDPSQEAAALALLNRTSMLAEIDPAKLDTLLRDVSTDSATIAALLSDFAEEAGALSLGLLGDTGSPLDASDAAEREGGVRLRIGEFTLAVDREVYDAWHHEVRLNVGADPTTITTEIGRRLGLAEYL
jgi:D-ribose pyranose/furanose isomerase RbsD